MKKAIILARVSTAGQAKEELPIASQVEAGHAKAAELDADVVKVFIEDGVSGRKAQRDVLDQAIEYCGVMEIDYLILWNTARFARNRAVAAWRKRELRRGGTELAYCSQNIDSKSDDGWLLEGFFELIDEQQSRTISKDTKRSMMKNARDGYFNGGRVPFGYTVIQDGRRRRMAILEEEAHLVREIFGQALAGAGTKSIALWLNTAGLLRRGNKWTKNTIGLMLGNWVYAGYITFNRVEHATRQLRPSEEVIRTAAHPPIVREEDFMSVQRMVAARAPAPGGSGTSGFYFTGLAKCGICGAGLQIRTGVGRKRKVYSYYQCGATIRGKACSSRMIPAPKLDAWLMDALMTRILARPRIEELARQMHELSGSWVKERAARRAALVAELRGIEARRRRLFELLEEHGKDAPNLGDLTSRLREHNARIRAIEGELAALEEMQAPALDVTRESIEEIYAFVEGTIRNGSPKKIREFLGSFVERVVLEDRRAVIHYQPARLVAGHATEVVRSTGKWLPDRLNLRIAEMSMELPERYWRQAA